MISSELQNALLRFAQLQGLDAASVAETTAAGAEPDWPTVLDLAAAAWLVDAEIFAEVILPRLTGTHPSFAELTQRPEVEPVPRLPDTWRVRADVAARRERPESTSLYEALARRWQARQRTRSADPAMELYFLSRLGGGAGWELFTELFAEAETRFDLDRSQQLLSLVRPPAPASPTPADSWAGLSRYLQRLAARVHFANDWYKTGRYYRRDGLHEALTRHAEARDSRWLLPLFAGGGTGKTMTLRAWAARDLIPNNVAVARIDFDFVGWQHLEFSPWLVLLPLAEDLAQQVATWNPPTEERRARPFDRIFEFRDKWSRWTKPVQPDAHPESQGPPDPARDVADRVKRCQHYAADFVESLPVDRSVVLLFDTTEEPYLHGGAPQPDPDGRPRGALPAVIEMLQEVSALRPGIRVVFSGRYDLFACRATDGRERIPGLTKAFGPVRQPSLEVRGFSRTETDAYLQDCCGLRLGEAVRGAIFEKSRITRSPDLDAATAVTGAPAALPFDLAFWARTAAEDPDLSVEKIQQATGLHYPIERVIRRITRPDVQWLVRYAVVPLRLTRDFLAEVLWEPLCRAVRGDATAVDGGKGSLDAVDSQWRQNLIWAVGGPVPEAIDSLWAALAAYAAGPEEGWLEVQGGTGTTGGTEQLRFHERVVEPLRTLLEREPVWGELQRSAQEYFLKRAAAANTPRDAGAWAEAASAALFHAFQESATAGETLWQRLWTEAQQRSWQDRRTLALMVLGDAGFEAGEERRPRCDRHGRRRVSPALERTVAREAARACLWVAVLAYRSRDVTKLTAEATGFLARARGLDAPAEDGDVDREDRYEEVGDWLKLAQSGRTPEQRDLIVRALAGTRVSDPTDGDSALLMLARGWAAEAVAEPDAWSYFDRVSTWAAAAGSPDLPAPVAATWAALEAGVGGQLGPAMAHWERLLNRGSDDWQQAADWLGTEPAELRLEAAYQFVDSGRPDVAAELAESVSRQGPPGVRLRAQILRQQAAQRVGNAGEPWDVFAELAGWLALKTAGPVMGDPYLGGLVSVAHALSLIRQAEINRSSELFDAARHRWKEGGTLNLAHGTAVAQVTMLAECGQLREARTVLGTVPRQPETSVPLTFPWPVSRLTAEVLLVHLRGEPVPREIDAARMALPDVTLGRRGYLARAELDATRVATGQPVLRELLARLVALPNAATRGAALWPFRLAAEFPDESKDQSPGRQLTLSKSNNEGASTKPARRAKPPAGLLAELRELFVWLARPAEVTDSDLPPLLSLAWFLRYVGYDGEARALVGRVLVRAAKLRRPWLWREATVLAARLELDVRAVPPLPEDRSHLLWQTALAPWMLLEAARRSFARGDQAAARRSLARARGTAAFSRLNQPPHLAPLREFEAELAARNGHQDEAIRGWEEAAAAWADMENEPRAARCRAMIRTFKTSLPAPHPPVVTERTDGVESPNVLHSRSGQLIRSLLVRPPPLLRIQAEVESRRVQAHFQPGGRYLDLQPMAAVLPEILAHDGQRALSEVHYHLRGANSALVAELARLSAQAYERLDPAPATFLRLFSPHAMVMALPWEAWIPATHRGQTLCRRSQPDWPPGRLIRWVQAALNRRGTKLALDGLMGPATEAALGEAWNSKRPPETVLDVVRHLAPPGSTSANGGKVSFGLVTEEPDSKIAEILRAAYQLRETERGSSLRGRPNTDLESAAQAAVLHLCGTFSEGSESGEAVLSTGAQYVSVNALTRLLDRGPTRSRPVVILEATWQRSEDPGQNERHLLRRNVFAHGLFATGQVLAVLATGTAGDLVRRAHETYRFAAAGGSLREVQRLFHETESENSPFGGPTTALWAPHPDLPLVT